MFPCLSHNSLQTRLYSSNLIHVYCHGRKCTFTVFLSHSSQWWKQTPLKFNSRSHERDQNKSTFIEGSTDSLSQQQMERTQKRFSISFNWKANPLVLYEEEKIFNLVIGIYLLNPYLSISHFYLDPTLVLRCVEVGQRSAVYVTDPSYGAVMLDRLQ